MSHYSRDIDYLHRKRFQYKKEPTTDVPTKKYEKLASEMFAIRNKLIKGQTGNL